MVRVDERSWEDEGGLCTRSQARHAFQTTALPSTARILDLAAGPGTLSFIASDFVSHVTGTDWSAGMVQSMAEKAKRLQLSNEQFTAEKCDWTD